MSGKGSANTRDYDRRAYWDSPLWNNMKTKRKNQDIWDAGKEEAKDMGIVAVDKFECNTCDGSGIELLKGFYGTECNTCFGTGYDEEDEEIVVNNGDEYE